MELKIKKLHPEAITPTRATPTESGLDLYALFDLDFLFNNESVVYDFVPNRDILESRLKPQSRILIPTGISIELPEPEKRTGVNWGNLTPVYNWYEVVEAQVRSKSGLAYKQGLMVLNSPGTIDNSYRGEIKVIVYNSSYEPQTIRNRQKIAQLVVSPVIIPKITLVDELSSSERGEKAFGSTGL